MEALIVLTEERDQEPVQNTAAAEPSSWEGSAVGKEPPQGKGSIPAHAGSPELKVGPSAGNPSCSCPGTDFVSMRN